MNETNLKWKGLFKFIFESLKLPLNHPEFILYFLFVIIALGGTGIWSTIYIENQHSVIDNKTIILNISSYVISILAAGSIELVFLDDDNIRKPISLIAFISIIIGVLLLFISYLSNVTFGYIFSIIGVCLALLIWWIGNSRNANLTKDYYGSRSKRANELSRNTDEYDEQL